MKKINKIMLSLYLAIAITSTGYSQITINNTSPCGSSQFNCPYSVIHLSLVYKKSGSPDLTQSISRGFGLSCGGSNTLANPFGSGYAPDYNTLSVEIDTYCSHVTFGNSNSNSQGNCASCNTWNYYTVWESYGNGVYNVRADMTTGGAKINAQSANIQPMNASGIEKISYRQQEEANNVSDVNDNNILSTISLPNPAKDNTVISYNLKENSQVELVVFDIAGKKILVRDQGVQASGVHEVKVDISAFSPGVYFYSLSTGKSRIMNKMVIAK